MSDLDRYLTDDLSALLDEWRALETAATEGPWEAVASYVDRVDDAASVAMCVRGNGIADDPDAEFIAASRTIVPRLIDAVGNVLGRARMEQDDAEFAMAYAAQINDGLMLASQQARKQAWADVTRAIITPLLEGDDD